MASYNQLELGERLATQYAMVRHRPDVVVWYQLLHCYFRALDRRTASRDEIWITKQTIVQLGMCAAKTALDATLAGYYTTAFGCIRQMTEHWFGVCYLEIFPESVGQFYGPEDGQARSPLPKMAVRIKRVMAEFEGGPSHQNEVDLAHATSIKETYHEMSQAHHLDAEAIVQTDPRTSTRFGAASYHPVLAEIGLVHGAMMTGYLAAIATKILSQYIPDRRVLIDDIDSAMASLFSADRVPVGELAQER